MSLQGVDICLWIKKVNKLLHPHRDRQEKLMSGMTEYKELSALALENDNKTMYLLLQREMSELFYEYLTLCFLDGIGTLIPHALAMWLISLCLPVLTLPFSLPLFGHEVGVIVWYPLVVVLFYVMRRLMHKGTISIKIDSVTK